MSTVIEEAAHPPTVVMEEADETCLTDVVGLKIPRRRILATVHISVDARQLPRRKPHASFETESDEETG